MTPMRAGQLKLKMNPVNDFQETIPGGCLLGSASHGPLNNLQEPFPGGFLLGSF